MLHVDSPKCTRVDVDVGRSVELLCNTSLSDDIMWTYDNDVDDGYVHYVYRKRRIYSNMPRLSVKSTVNGVHSLVIADAELKQWTVQLL